MKYDEIWWNMYTRDGMKILFQLGAEVGHIMSCNMYIHRTRHTKHMIPTPFQSYDYETYSQMQEATPTLGVTLQMSKKRDLHEKILKSNGCTMEPLNRCCWFLRFQLASSALSNPRSANLPEGYTLVGWKTRIRHGFLRILSYQWKAPSSWHSSWRLLSHSGFWWPPSSPVAECVDG